MASIRPCAAPSAAPHARLHRKRVSSAASRRPQNAPGTLFVDSSCIDCEACRALAPAIFARLEGQSAVVQQPEDDASRLLALQAVLVCPTASIHLTDAKAAEMAAAHASFPVRVTPNVFYLGYHSRHSFGAASYFIQRQQGGNVMVESPRFSEQLAARLEALGGVRHIWLSHRDDVGDAERWAARFGAARCIHADEGVPAERLLEGSGPWTLDGEDDCVVLHTPGHTRGSCSLLHKEIDGTLFSGDSLSATPESYGKVLEIFTDFCWYSVDVQLASLRRLLGARFARVLPGHGRRALFSSSAEKDEALLRLLAAHAG